MNFYLYIITILLIMYGVIILYTIMTAILGSIEKNRLRKQCKSGGTTEAVYNSMKISVDEKYKKLMFGFKPSQVFQNTTNFVIGITAIFTLINSSLSNSVSYRPYVSITSMGISNDHSTSGFELHLTLVNTGNVPAANVRLYSQNYFNKKKINSSEPNQPIFIPPNKDGLDFELKYPKDNIYKYFEDGNDWKIKVDISYDGVYQKNLFTTATFKYNLLSKSFVIIEGDAK